MMETLDRLPPHSIEAEMGILGCAMTDPMEVMQKLGSEGVEPDLFYDLKHQEIFCAMTSMMERGDRFDVITLQQHLKDRGKLDRVGGISYLMSLIDAVPSAANVRWYLEIAREKHMRRRLLRTCQDLALRSQDESLDIRELVDGAERDVLAIGLERRSKQARHIKESIPGVIDEVERNFKSDGAISGLTTGLEDLDRQLCGMAPTDLVVIGARPSQGKTSLGMQIAVHNAALGVPVGVFSLEMSEHQLTMRTMGLDARVSLLSMRRGTILESDFPKLTGAAARLQRAPIYIDDEAGLNIGQVRSRARMMVSRYGIKLFVLDYQQRFDIGREDGPVGYGRVSGGAKDMAKELGATVILLSQLSRDVEKANRMPKLSDLKETGKTEQDADSVILLWKDKTDDPYADAWEMKALVEKNRNGATGPVDLFFLRQFTRFESVTRATPEPDQHWSDQP